MCYSFLEIFFYHLEQKPIILFILFIQKSLLFECDWGFLGAHSNNRLPINRWHLL